MIPVEQVTCDHDYQFLRQERRNIGFDRDPVWLVEDIFHCRKCLNYQRIAVEKRRPNPSSFSEQAEYVERLK